MHRVAVSSASLLMSAWSTTIYFARAACKSMRYFSIATRVTPYPRGCEVGAFSRNSTAIGSLLTMLAAARAASGVGDSTSAMPADYMACPASALLFPAMIASMNPRRRALDSLSAGVERLQRFSGDLL